MTEFEGPEGEGHSYSTTRRGLLVGVAAAAALAAVEGPTALARSRVSDAIPRHGGVLRVGFLAEPPTASITNPWQWNGVIGLARLGQVMEKLTDFGPKTGAAIPQLATSWEPSGSAQVWRVKLREGVVFHNGKPFTADDVIYSFQKILDPTTKASPRSVLANVLAQDGSGMKKIGPHEIEFRLTMPYATFGNILANQMFIAPAGWVSTASDPYVTGTGPFKIQSFQAGTVTVFARNSDYWDGSKPYLDGMQFISIVDESARLNALLSGQADVAHSLSPASVRAMSGKSNVKPLISKTAHWIPLVMAAQRPPFTDVRVRQAMRLIVDRPEMIKKALSGYGSLGNDLISPFDPMYAKDLPQRHQDLDKAKFLLKQAGKSGLQVTLNTSAITAGALESAQVFARQAKGAGVKVTISNSPPNNYFDTVWQRKPFFYDENGDFTIDQGQALFFSSKGPYNETQFPPAGRPYSKRWDQLIANANATLNPSKRKALWEHIQKIEYDEGGMIIPFFANPLDGLSSKVQGLKSHWRRELGFFQFKNVWFSA